MNKYYLLCILAIFFFSTIEIVGKLVDSSISPIAITSYRFLTGSIFLLIPVLFNIKNYIKKITAFDLIYISLIGILNVCISMYMLQLGIYYGQAALSAIIISSNPIFVGIFALFILKEKINFLSILCWFFGLIGLSMVIFGQDSISKSSRNLSLGILFSLLASVTFGLYTVLSKRFVMKYDSKFFNAVSFLAGALVLMVMGFAGKQEMLFQLNTKNLITILYLGIFVTGIAYLAFFNGLKGIATASGSIFFLLKPVFASIMAFFILHERLSFIQIAGVVIVLLSLLVTNTKNNKITLCISNIKEKICKNIKKNTCKTA